MKSLNFSAALLPVLRFDKVAAFAEDLHRRGVALGLHKAFELDDVLSRRCVDGKIAKNDCDQRRQPTVRSGI